MTRIIGFEGSLSKDAIATYGAAMLSDGERIWNGLSGLTGPSESALDYFRSGAATRIKPAVEIGDVKPGTTPFIVAVFRGGWVGRKVEPRDSDGAILDVIGDGFFGFVFGSSDIFDAYAKRVAKAFAGMAWRATLAPKQRPVHVSAGLTFCHRDPELHALRVACSDNRKAAEQTAEMLLKTDEDRAVFRDALPRALRLCGVTA